MTTEGIKKTKRTRKPKGTEPTEIDAASAVRTPGQDRMALKRKVAIFYDLQRLRLQTAGRTYERPDGSTIQLHEVDLAILERRARELKNSEKSALRDVLDHLRTMPFYNQVLSDKARYRGIGPTMAGVILSSFDIAREDTASKMWSFAGLAPVAARRCRHCHVVVEASVDSGLFSHRARRAFRKPGAPEEPEKKSKCPVADRQVQPYDTYESGQAMRPTKGEKLPYNAFLKTKLVGVLGPVMLKCGSPWKKFYDDYKHRKASEGWGTSDAHRHAAAIRYMVKQLLLDIWKEWRAHLGLPVRPSYQEEKLGHAHGAPAVGAPDHPAPEEPPLSPEVEAELAMV